MPTFRSSIFSFDTLQLEKARPKGFFSALLLTLALVVAAEMGARLLVNTASPYGEYWEEHTGLKFEAYRQQIVQGQPPHTLIIGDSTALCGIDPQALQLNLPEASDIYTLASPANYPMASRCTTLPLLNDPYAPPKLVIALFIPTGFVATDSYETRILDSPICRKVENPVSYHGELRLLWLTRLVSHLKNPGSVQESLKQVRQQGGFKPLMEAAPEQKENAADTKPAEKTGGLKDERVQVIRDLARLARNRNFKLILVVPPLKHSGKVMEDYIERMRQVEEEEGLTLLDFSAPPFLLPRHFLDDVHLNKDGAALFSQELGRRISAGMAERVALTGQRERGTGK